MDEEQFDATGWRVGCQCDGNFIHLINHPEELPYVPDYCPECETRLVATPLFTPNQLRDLLDLEELIDQLTFAHRELQQLEEKGIDDTGNLGDRIAANRELQAAVETLRETISAEESAQTSQTDSEGDAQ